MSTNPVESNYMPNGFYIEEANGRRRYPSKFCRNQRTHKSNGRLHRFCEVHRQRANRNQRRWNHTRRYREAARLNDEVLVDPLARAAETNGRAPPSTATTTTTEKPVHTRKDITSRASEVDSLGDLMFLLMSDPFQSDGIRTADWDYLKSYGFVPTTQPEIFDFVETL